MNGPEHFAEAERVRRAIRTAHDASMEGFDGWQRDDLIALATLHATLALAAAQQDANEATAMCDHGVTGLCMSCVIANDLLRPGVVR